MPLRLSKGFMILIVGIGLSGKLSQAAHGLQLGLGLGEGTGRESGGQSPRSAVPAQAPGEEPGRAERVARSLRCEVCAARGLTGGAAGPCAAEGTLRVQ